jgi:hypothetical protein
MRVKYKKQSNTQSKRKQNDSLEIISWMNYNWPFEEASEESSIQLLFDLMWFKGKRDKA